MPDLPDFKVHAHPHTHGYSGSRANSSIDRSAPKCGAAILPVGPRTADARYAELCVTSNFTFLTGASHPDEFACRAAELGYHAIAVTDHNSLAGVVRAHVAAKESGIRLVVGCRLVFTEPDWLSILVYPTDRKAYGNLCRLLTAGKRRAPKGQCHLTLDDLIAHQEGLLGVVVLPGNTCPLLYPPQTENTDVGNRSLCARGSYRPPLPHGRGTVLSDTLSCLRDIFDDDRLSISLTRLYASEDEQRIALIQAMAEQVNIPLVAVNDVYYHIPQRRDLQDVVTCIRHTCALSEAGLRLFSNGERYLKPHAEMARLFADHAEALARTVTIADRATFSLDELRYEYPDETYPPNTTPLEHLKRLTWEGAKDRYPDGVPGKVCRQIEHEFSLIEELEYARYFLTVHDLVAFARSRGILCQGRGAAANSAVCFCLGVTSVDPDRINLLFERFVSRERNEPPDIDIDFEHERREEVIQYIYQKYGRDRAGLTAEVITYRRRSAIRDVGKVLGFSLDALDSIAKRVDRWEKNPFADSETGDVPAQLDKLGFDPTDNTVQLLIRIVRELMGFPRHLSQHVGGFVMTRGPLCELVPIENAAMPNRTVIEWDKDDIDAMGMLKVDVLGLGMLTCIRKALAFINSRHEETKARSHGGEERRESAKGREHGANEGDDDEYQDVSGLDCVAKGHGVGQEGLHSYPVDAQRREVRADSADATGGDLASIEHCGRIRPPESPRIPSLPQNSARIANGTPDADSTQRRVAFDAHTIRVEGTRRRNGSRSPGVDPKSGQHSEVDVSARPTELRASGSSCLRASSSFPSCLRGPVPQCLTLASIPPEDPAVYDMICQSDTLGVFQIESRAQMTMLPRLQPRCFYDLVIEVAIVRPGPIIGQMVHPYLRRRNGEEEVTYPDDTVKEVLGRTLGVPLFQEQVMSLAVRAAGFTPGEAERLRRAITAWTSKDKVIHYTTRFIQGMLDNGYSREFADWCFQRMKGFSQYGFPESHAASFALLVYASSWIKCHYPAVFAAALLNSQPLGFYAPAQIVRDARDHGVTVRPVDVNHSQWDCTLENGGTVLRLGMRMVKGLKEQDGRAVAEAVTRSGRFHTPFDLWQTSEVSASSLRTIARADAFRSMGLDRRLALWEMQALHGTPLPLLDQVARRRQDVALPHAPAAGEVTRDYQMTGLSLKAHPMSFLRETLGKKRVTTAVDVKDECKSPFGRLVSVAGLVLFRQRPGTAKGVMFMTLEDETGRVDLIVRPNVYERYRNEAVYARMVLARGRVERRGRVVHVLATSFADIEHLADELPRLSRDFR